MKNLITLILIIHSSFSFGQSDYVLVERQNENLHFLNYKNVIKYDSLKNQTVIKLDDKFKGFITGEWSDFNKKKYFDESLVSHCPVLIDENNIICEVGIFTNEIIQRISGTSNLKSYNKLYLRFNKKVKSTIVTSNFNEEKNFYIYKTKYPSRIIENFFFTSYHLIGEKNKKIYHLAIYNIDETNFENFDKFLIDTFNNN